jgi:hypothetical protein
MLRSIFLEEAFEMPEWAEEVVEHLSTSHLKLILGDSMLSSSSSGTDLRVARLLSCRT